MKQSTLNSAVPAAVLRKLHLVRKRTMFVHVASALVAATAVLLVAMAIAMIIDWLATLYDSRWRLVLTATAVATAVATSVGWIILAWRRALRLEQVAADVDRQVPRLEERWTTMTRLGEDAAKPNVVHPAMLRRLSLEAASWEPRIEPENVVSLSLLMRTMLALTAVTAVLALAVVLNTHEVLVLAHRFLMPGSSISATKLVDVPGDLVIARGEPLALNAAIEGTPVENAILFLQPEAKPPQTITLVAERQEPVAFSHRMRAVEEPFAYRFRAGDGQTAWFNVDVADRPEIDRIKLIVTPPSYTGQPAKAFDKLPERLSTLRNSHIEIAVRPKAPVESAQLKLDNERLAPMSLGSDGWLRWTTTLSESCSLTPILTEQHGLTNRRAPKCQLIAYEDQPPTVKVLSPDDKTAVRPDDTFPITFSATDDVGIGSAELVVYRENGSKEPIQLADIPIDLGKQQGSRLVQQTVDLDLKTIGAKDGTELSFEIRVREDRGNASQQAASPTASPTAFQNTGQDKALASSRDRAETQTAAHVASENKIARQSPAMAGAESKKSTAANQPQTTAATRATPTNSSAANSPISQESSSSVPKQENLAKSPGQAPANRAAASPQQQMPAKPNIAALAANENAKAHPFPMPKQPQTVEKSAAGSTKQAAAPAPSTAENKTASTTSESKPTATPAGKGIVQPPTAAMAESKAPASPMRNNSSAPPEPRTVSSGRQSVMPNSKPNARDPSANTQTDQSPTANSLTAKNSQNAMKNEQAANVQPPASRLAKGMKNESTSDNSAASASQAQSPAENRTAADNQRQTASAQSTPPPGDDMPRRSLDVPQSASSQRTRLKVDQWAGSFAGQRRAKLEMAIEPELVALDEKLAKTQRTARGVLDGLETEPKWQVAYDRDVASAQQLVADGKEIVEKLVAQSKDTPYAFIGLQVADIGAAHIEPARSAFWNAIQSKGDDRATSVRDGWQHVGRARQLLADLRGQFERSRREFQLAESMERVKKMYQVYIENTQALLQIQDTDPDRYARKTAEFELDDEYLKRLKEVLKMRADLQAELARIFAEDPRLLRRFMDNLRARSNNLREQLADLAAKQHGLNREVRAWSATTETEKPQMAQLLLMQNLQEANKIATSAGELQDRYKSWLPLQKESKDASWAAVDRKVQEVATGAGELRAQAERFIAGGQQAAATATSADGAPANADAETPAAANGGQALDQVIAGSESLYGQLMQLELALRQVASRENQADAALFAANRLVDTRRLIADTSAWVRQIRAHKAGSYTGAAEVAQYRLAMKTDELAGKLGDLERTLSGLLERTDGSLPEPIAVKSREFMATLDKEASPNQLAAVYALHGNQLPRATDHQLAAGAALAKSEKLYDELMRLAITEMDKLPVQDPIASLLEDPTLDELLAQLERELPLAEALGIPLRPSNLKIVDDWLRPGRGGGGGGGWRRLAMNQLKQDQDKSQEKLKAAYQRAIARALKESKPKQTVALPKSTKLSDWNLLVSKLDNDLQQGRDKAPPEQYRRAIEQYFAQISRELAEQEKQPQ